MIDAEREQEIVDRVYDELTSGKTFQLWANSQQGRYTDWVVLGRRDYAQVLQGLGQMAAQSDALAQIASHIVASGLPLYQTKHELAAKVFRAAATTVVNGYDNVIERSGPEPDRARVAPFKVETLIALAYWLKYATNTLDQGGGPGWVIDRLRQEYRVQLPTMLLDKR